MRAFFLSGSRFGNFQWSDYTEAFGYTDRSKRSPADFFKNAISFTVRVLVVDEKDFRFHIEGNPEQCQSYVKDFFEFYEGLKK